MLLGPGSDALGKGCAVLFSELGLVAAADADAYQARLMMTFQHKLDPLCLNSDVVLVYLQGFRTVWNLCLSLKSRSVPSREAAARTCGTRNTR